MDCYTKIIHISNMYYNEGLERAKVRDLSGAAQSLRKSLKFYKMNIQARNLLGLIYFEMGETVDALGEWVISKSLVPNNNAAEEYLAAVQSNGNKLEALNQTIKKYNQALLYCRQDSEDLAVIQLKKVLSLNPRLVKGHQLLALLYMKEGQYDLAKKALRNAGRIDANNTTTLRYLREVNMHLHNEQPSKKNQRKEKEELVAYQSGNETIIHPANFKDNSAFTTIINIIIGVVIGALITGFLIVPSVKQNAKQEAKQDVREANDIISTKNQTIKTLENQVEELQAQIEDMEGANSDSQSVITVYEQMFRAYDAFLAEDYTGAGMALENVDPQVLTGKASEIYQNISGQVNERYIETLYDEGYDAYQSQQFAVAAETLQKVVDIDETYEEWYAVYYLAQAYRKLEKSDQAMIYYQKLVDNIPGTERARSASNYLEELQETPE